MKEILTTIIFSKDRACQLDNLLNSMQDTCLTWKWPEGFKTYVIYTFSSSEFELGYKKVIDKYKHDRLCFVEQDIFSEQVLNFIKDSEITGFITDDSMFHRKPEFPNMRNVGVYSLRYGFNTVIQDPFKQTYQPILNKYIDEENYIRWNSLDYHPLNNYGFQCSMDGHYLWSCDLLKMINFDFKNPSQLESKLFHNRGIINPHIRSEKQSSLVNIPLNNAGGYTEFLEANLNEINQQYLEGKNISFKIENIKGCHQVLEWEMI